jgi:hypothetical protein
MSPALSWLIVPVALQQGRACPELSVESLLALCPPEWFVQEMLRYYAVLTILPILSIMV